jgi:hypothetical protein
MVIDSLPSVEPFFIVGFQRSGTTLLRLMLNAHPQIAIPHDSAELWPTYARLASTRYRGLRTPDDVHRMIDDLLAEPRIHAWQTTLPRDALMAEPLPSSFPDVMRRFHVVYARARGKLLWGDKNTGILVELDRLNAEFPRCRIIHLVRDGRDCAQSHRSKDYVYGYENVLRVALEWREQVTLCHKMGAMLPRERFHELRYEDLLANPTEVLSRLCNFLGIPFSPLMLEYYHQVEHDVPQDRRSLWPLIDRPPVASNAFKWKSEMSSRDRAIFERTAGHLLRTLGYETSEAATRHGRFLELWYLMHSKFAWRLRRVGRLLPSRRPRLADLSAATGHARDAKPRPR